MPLLDTIVFATYVLAMLSLALIYAGRNSNVSEMFGAGGRAPWWVAGMSSFMTMFSAGSFVVWGGLAYREGMVAVSMLVALGISGIIVAYAVAPRWKRLKISSAADFIERRFNERVNAYFTLTLIFVRVLSSAVALYALAVVLAPLVLPSIQQATATSLLILVLGVTVVAYTMIGGLWAVLMTDVLQFIILSIAVALIVVLSFSEVGGLKGFLGAVEPTVLAPINDVFSPLVIVAWVVTHVFVLGAEWAFVQRHLSVPKPRDARKAMILFAVLYLVSPIIWMAPAMAFRVLEPNQDPEQAYVLVAMSVLPKGLLGLMAAAMFSATASMISSQLNVFSGILTEKYYSGHRATISQSKQVWFGRAVTSLIGLVVILFALSIPFLGGAESVVFALMSLVISPLFAPALWGLFSSRITARAVWLTTLSSTTIGITLRFILPMLGDEISLLSSLGNWVSTNPRLVEAVVGVVLPLLILSYFEWLSYPRKIEGAKNAIEAVDISSGAASDSFLPLLVVSVSLILCALITGALILVNPDDTAILVTTTCVLAFMGAALVPTLVSKKNSQALRDEYT